MRIFLMGVDVNGKVVCGKGDFQDVKLTDLFTEQNWDDLKRDFGYVCELHDDWAVFEARDGKRKYGVQVICTETNGDGDVSRIRYSKNEEGEIRLHGWYDEYNVYEGDFGEDSDPNFDELLLL